MTPPTQQTPSEGVTRRTLRAAIAGNPNSGKTSLFNQLTGSNRCVGNYPGVTVERHEGTAVASGEAVHMVDLPGTYSLTAYSAEEVVARKVIIHEHPDVVVDVVDAANLERNLYLTVQLLEMETPLVIALNMLDVARRHELVIDTQRLSELLGIPVVETDARQGRGSKELIGACHQFGRSEQDWRPTSVAYGHPLDEHVERLSGCLAKDDGACRMYRPRWAAIKLLEKDPELRAGIERYADRPDAILRMADEAVHAIETHSGEDSETLVAEGRYGFAAGIVRQCVSTGPGQRRRLTDAIDSVVCNRLTGPLVLAGVVYLLFVSVFKVADEWPWLLGKSPTEWTEWLFEGLAGLVAPLEGVSPMLHSVLADGVIGGVGGVMSFVPLIFVMFVFVAVLEDTGYIARVAFLLDRLLRSFGLQGRSILSMIISGGLGAGGCAVPGVLATRTMRDRRDRLVTMMVAPIMNCGAKIPVYLMLVGAFFSAHRAGMMFLLWGLSWMVALGCAWLLRRLVIRGEQTPFVMELPSYHLPTVRGVMRHAWGRTWMYIRKAGTIILAVSLVMWASMYFPRADAAPASQQQTARDLAQATGTDVAARLDAVQAEHQLKQSFAGRMGTALTTATQWAGFDWRDNVALIGGFAAKEVVVGTLGVAYSMGNVDPEETQPLSERLGSAPDWSPLRAMSLLVFVMIYAPCMTTLAVIRRESGSWRWPLFATAYTTTLAFVLAIAVYQIGGALGVGT